MVAESEGTFDLGVTFDGDADRALFCDAAGRVVNGDGVLLAAARDLHAQGKLKADTVVSTTMSNMGLEIALKNSGIRMLRANVGDKYVSGRNAENRRHTRRGAVRPHHLSRLRRHHWRRPAHSPATDGYYCSSREASGRVDRRSESVSAEDSECARPRENSIRQVPSVQAAIDAAERELDGNGRVVVRYSGTETLARVMVEAESEDKMNALTAAIAAEIQKALGV